MNFNPASDADAAQEWAEADDENKPAKTRCASCSGEAKYRCPACDTPSCSLACVKQHKAAMACTGKRDLTAFRDIREFDDKTLISDYRFLEDAQRSVEGAGRAAAATPSSGAGSSATPVRRKLCTAATERGVELDLMPVGMKRQRENTSYYDARRKRMAWRVELVFDRAGVHHIETAVAEGTTIRSILADVLLPPRAAPEAPAPGSGEPSAAEPATAGSNAPASATSAANARRHKGGGEKARRAAEEDGQRSILRHRLRAYSRRELEDVLVLMPVHRRPANDPRFLRLRLDDTLAEALHSQVVLEFPTLHILLKSDSALEGYPLLDAGPAGAPEGGALEGAVEAGEATTGEASNVESNLGGATTTAEASDAVVCTTG